MKRLMFFLLTTLAAGANTCFVATVHAQTPHVLMWSDLALNQLYFLTQATDRELMTCGMGDVSGDTAYVRYVILTPLVFSDTASVRSKVNCPPSTLVWQHNHPWTGPSIDGLWSTPAEQCGLSMGDQQMMRQIAAPFVAVAVGRADPKWAWLCWWPTDPAPPRQPYVRSVDGFRLKWASA